MQLTLGRLEIAALVGQEEFCQGKPGVVVARIALTQRVEARLVLELHVVEGRHLPEPGNVVMVGIEHLEADLERGAVASQAQLLVGYVEHPAQVRLHVRPHAHMALHGHGMHGARSLGALVMHALGSLDKEVEHLLARGALEVLLDAQRVMASRVELEGLVDHGGGLYGAAIDVVLGFRLNDLVVKNLGGSAGEGKGTVGIRLRQGIAVLGISLGKSREHGDKVGVLLCRRGGRPAHGQALKVF